MPQLDALREGVVDRLSRAGGATLGRARGWVWSSLWWELIYPVRTAWVCLALAWGVIGVLHWANPAPDETRRGSGDISSPLPRELRMVLAEQWQLRAELLGAEEGSSGARAARRVPGPRSQGTAGDCGV
jgi:hypothetical protein